MKTLGCGVIFAMIAPLLFGVFVLICYGAKMHMINAESHRRYEEKKALEALAKSLEPPKPYSQRPSPDGRYVFLYFKDDIDSKRKRVELRDNSTGKVLLKYQTDAVIKTRSDRYMPATGINATMAQPAAKPA